MRWRLFAGVLLFAFRSDLAQAQAADPNLVREVEAVRAAVERNSAILSQYSWIEHTDVFVKGEVKSSRALTCRYNTSGEVTKTPIGDPVTQKRAKAKSNNPRTRKKADMQDYIERASSLIQAYVPLKPNQIDAMVRNGSAFLEHSEAGKSQVRFERYFQAGDSLIFTYDPVSKALLRASIKSTLGSPKDPVTLDAIFETLPDGANHLASTELNAPKRKVQVKMKNDTYVKLRKE